MNVVPFCKKLGFGVFLLLVLSGLTPQPAVPEQTSSVPELHSLEALLPSPFEKGSLVAASSGMIYETPKDAGASWKKWARLPAPGLSIQKLFYFKELPKTLFILTKDSLYRKSLEGSYDLLYQNQKSGGGLTDFTLDPQNLSHYFLGTSAGLLESNDQGKSWRLFTPAGKDRICFARFASGRFLIAFADHLLVSRNFSHFDKSFSLRDLSDADSESSGDASVSEDTPVSQACEIRELAYDSKNGSFWLATQRGVFESTEPETDWSALSSTGLRSRDIRFLIHPDFSSRLIAANLEGVYVWLPEKNSWAQITSGNGLDIRGISADEHQIYAVTDSRLLNFPLLPDHIQIPDTSFLNQDLKNSFRQLIRLEPSALRVQRAVTRVSNTGNSKTKLWQAESRLRALVPTFYFGKDFSRKNNVDIDRGGTADADKFIQGPEDASKGWNAHVAWDLGDFIFSSNQTSIDSWEKLMMELRHDFTAEATRFYYERRRLQAETLFTPAVSEQEHLEKLLQIEELTALLDSMTGGFMSHELEKMYREHPELEKLWEWHGSNPHEAVTNKTKAMRREHKDTS